MTPQEAARLVDNPNPFRSQELQEFVISAFPSELQIFIHTIKTNTTDAKGWREHGRVAIEIRLAEQGMQISENLSRQTDRLISIANEQKNLAAKLENQTNKIICLTWALVIFSVALLAVSLVTIKIMLKENPQTNIQQIQTSQNQKNITANK